MTFLFKNTFRVESTRHPNWNYADDGMYFVTICTQDKFCYFGEVVDEKMNLNKIGQIAKTFWLEIPKHFFNVILDEFIVMPNHIHGIIFICNDDVRKYGDDCQRRDAIYRVSTGGVTGKHNPMGTNSLGEIIRAYKSAVKRYFTKNNIHFSWQSRFYDRVIRNEYELNRVRSYIYYNPIKWGIDRNNLKNLLM
jgi:REP element-mobilizing transposase RayT